MNSFLENLPNINFAEKDVAVIEAEIIAHFEKSIGRTLFPGDPLRLLLLTFVHYLTQQRNIIDFAGKQNLLKYATDGFIQNIGALVGTTMLEPMPAVTTLEFTISTILPNNTIVPKGTRTTPGNNIFFATTEDVEIIAGDHKVIATAVCTQVGSIGNGFLPGQINRLSDPFPFHSSVQNTTTTQGGTDRESLESFRERTRLAPESYSTAGPYGAYEYWAKSASQLIIDVSVKSPSPGVVEIVPLLQGGEIPTQSILDEVYAACNDDQRRPLTDHVVVRAPETIKYSLEFTYFIARIDSAIGTTIQQRVYEVVENFILWQKSKLGRDINPTRLIEMVKSAGVKRIDMYTIQPSFTVLQYYELGVADLNSINVIYGGLEDD